MKLNRRVITNRSSITHSTGTSAARRYALSVPSDAVPYFRITTGATAPIRISRVSFSVFDMDTESHRGRG